MHHPGAPGDRDGKRVVLREFATLTERQQAEFRDRLGAELKFIGHAVFNEETFKRYSVTSVAPL